MKLELDTCTECWEDVNGINEDREPKEEALEFNRTYPGATLELVDEGGFIGSCYICGARAAEVFSATIEN